MKYTFKKETRVTTVTEVVMDLENIVNEPTYLHYKFSGGYDYWVRIVPIFVVDYSTPEQRVTDDIKGWNVYIVKDEKITRTGIDLNRITITTDNNNIIKDVKYNPTVQSNNVPIEVIFYLLTGKRYDDCFFSHTTKEIFDTKVFYFLDITN